MNIQNKIKLFSIMGLLVCSFLGSGQTKKFKVTLDAGHGDHDFGAVYNGHVEKKIALAIVLKVGTILEGQPNFEVNYTRQTDVFIGLEERANIANRVDASIFVSIHCNANKNTAADGTETYVMGMTKNASSLAVAKNENEVVTLEKDYKQKYNGYDPSSPETLIGLTLMQEDFLNNSIALAAKVEDGFSGIGKKIRGGGVKQAPYMVLHKAYMPRILIETGFVSNPVEGAILDSEEGQNKIADAIAQAIISYKKEYFGNGEGYSEENRPSNKIEEKPYTDSAALRTSEIGKDDQNSIRNKKNNLENQKEIFFKVQIASSTTKMDLEPNNFKGLENISIENAGTIYKYFYGQTSDYKEVKKFLLEAKSKGYNSAFLIALKNGKSIPIKDAIK